MPATLQRIPSLPTAKLNAEHHLSVRTLIDDLILEQNLLLTPVARFAEMHDRIPDQEPHYRRLIPLTKPRSGEQYAFEVSLDRCTGCKSCVSACHSLNGLDAHEAWRDTGAVLGGDASPGWQQTITTACHHCEDPGCLNGCPVAAYQKDPNTGIVRHLDDQCIGCSYCILKCPYDVPKYSKKRGIVRKCDMCHSRLADGEAPACVQACPTEAIRIVTVSKERQSDVNQTASSIFPSAIDHPQSCIPSSQMTYPTTRYIGREIPVTVYAADRDALIPQHAHWPLIFMLVFTQAGIGLFLGAAVTMPTPLNLIIAASIIFYVGMTASIFHLGQPLKAWRFFLGLKTSWLSREILAFSIISPLPIILSVILFLPDFPYKSILQSLAVYSMWPFGLLAIFTSVMIYQDTHRAFWSLPRGAARFFGTFVSFFALAHLIVNPQWFSYGMFGLILVSKILLESMILRNAKHESWTADRHSARLQLGPLRAVLTLRVSFAIAAMVIAAIQPWFALPILLMAEIFERQIFFQAVHAPKMPGNFGPSVNTH